MSSPASALKLENVLYEKKGAIAYVTINRPKVLNALNAKTISELRSAFEDARDDSEVRGVVFTGAGDKSFAAGVDIGEMANDTPLTAEAKTRSGQALTDLIENLGKPVIAAVNGFALGGGCELSMASTVRIAAETARFGQPEVKIGVMPGYGGTRSEEHTSELQSRLHLVCRLLLEKKKNSREDGTQGFARHVGEAKGRGTSSQSDHQPRDSIVYSENLPRREVKIVIYMQSFDSRT